MQQSFCLLWIPQLLLVERRIEGVKILGVQRIGEQSKSFTEADNLSKALEPLELLRLQDF